MEHTEHHDHSDFEQPLVRVLLLYVEYYSLVIHLFDLRETVMLFVCSVCGLLRNGGRYLIVISPIIYEALDGALAAWLCGDEPLKRQSSPVL
jgi:hypothetical protein